MSFFDRFRSRPAGSPHHSWALERIGESASSQRGIQELVDALRSLQGTSEKGLFGLAIGSLAITDEEKRDLEARLGAALIAHRDAFEKAEDVTSLMALSKLADVCNLPALRLTKRYPLRCDPLGDTSALDAEWQARIARLRRVKEGSSALQWARATEYLADDQAPKEVMLGEPDDASLYEFALRYEQSNEQDFSRELAAVWSVVNGINVDDMWWYLAPAGRWSWEDEGLQIGGGQSVQGRLILVPNGKSKNLAEAKVVDIDDDGELLQEYASLGELLDRLLPEE